MNTDQNNADVSKQYDQFFQLAQKRQTVRGFQKDRSIPEEDIIKILDTARTAPSGGNAQPWEFVVVRDKEIRHKIAELYMKQHEDKREMEKLVRGTVKMAGPGFRDASVHIIVLGDPRAKYSYPIRTMLEKADKHLTTGLANATMLIHLAAASLGFATQYVSDASSPYMSTIIKHWFNIPQEMVVYEIIPIGYPVKYPKPTPRRELNDIIHWDTYDMSKYRSDEEFNKFLSMQTRIGAYGKAKETAQSDEVGLMFDEEDAQRQKNEIREG